ncbi:MAG: alkaline phosphatase [Gammaproteobacteria bacterium]|nr:MAG: alkaline phosphatase [Gammaproteobacteria bacterium]RLA37871.1 MAG: alkaline phosphatase [Gammaproteobacteria bacterium]
MNRKFTRREALIGVSSTLLLPVACSQAGIGSDAASDLVFLHGIASGDPDSTSIVIWTRVSNADGQTEVDWRVATDESFQNVVASGQYMTDANRDHTVKVVVDRLIPGQEYFYRFDVEGIRSPVGQTKTLPTGHVDRLVLAVATCANYAFGYFNAYEVIAEDPNVDLVVHLGDYFYEHGPDEYGGETGRRIGRNHEPAHEAVTLADYRQRLAQYKTDPGSKAMHARHPLVVLWDDHETANNPWMGGAKNHQADEGDWATRRDASLQAFYEWLPIRDPHAGGTREEYWRHYKFGDLASLITLETRHTGRSKQIEIDSYLDNINSKAEAQEFITTVVGAADRNLLSSEMKQFLADELAESVNANRRWRIIGNPSVMARRIAPDLQVPFFATLRSDLDDDATHMLDGLKKHGSLELPVDLDSWNGYPQARENFYQISKDAGAHDLLFLAGDSHSFWQNELYDAAGESMGVELGATGITSPRSLLDLGQEGLRRFDELNAANNAEIVWTEGRYRGFIRLELDHDGAHADFVTVTNVETRSYSTKIVRSVDIESRDGTLRYT